MDRSLAAESFTAELMRVWLQGKIWIGESRKRIPFAEFASASSGGAKLRLLSASIAQWYLHTKRHHEDSA